MKTTYSTILVLSLFLGVAHSAFAQDLLVTAKGDSINVKIVTETIDSVTFRYRINTIWHTMTSDKSTIKVIERDFYRSNNRAGIMLGLLGGTTLVSAGPEIQFPLNNRSFMAFKTGLGYNEELIVITLFGEPRKPEKFVNMTNSVTVNFGKEKHFLEIGSGLDYVNSSYGNNGWITYGISGYRYQNERLTIRLYLVPFAIGSIPDSMTMSPIGGSLGLRL